jgi:hypothetical protein
MYDQCKSDVLRAFIYVFKRDDTTHRTCFVVVIYNTLYTLIYNMQTLSVSVITLMCF